MDSDRATLAEIKEILEILGAGSEPVTTAEVADQLD